MAAQPNCKGIDLENERRAASGGKGGGVAIPVAISNLETMDDAQRGPGIFGEDDSKSSRFFVVWNKWLSDINFVWSLIVMALWMFPYNHPVRVSVTVVFIAYMYIVILIDWYTDWRRKAKIHLSLFWVDVIWLCNMSFFLWFSLGVNGGEWVTPAWGRRGLLWSAETSFLCLCVQKFHIALLAWYRSPGEGFPSVYVISGCVSTVVGILLGMYYYMVASSRWFDSPWCHHPVAVSAILADLVVSYRFLPSPHGTDTEDLLP